MRVEYISIIDATKNICKNKKSFENLLQSNDDILISRNKIKFREYEYNYKVQIGSLENGNKRYIHLTIDATRPSDSSPKKSETEELLEIDNYLALLKAIRDIMFLAASKPVQVIWDDVSFYFSSKAYPLIHDIENTMRKLITKFMLINVGLGWTSHD